MVLLSFLVFVVALFILWALSRGWAPPYRDALSALAALITAITFFSAGLWYLRERPYAPKLKISVEAKALPLSAGDLLVLIEVELENVGSTLLRLKAPENEEERKRLQKEAGILRLFIQPVTPLLDSVAKELSASHRAGQKIDVADNWGALANVRYPLDLALDAAEVESLYFRVRIPCQPDFRFYVTARLPKQPLTIERWFLPASSGMFDGAWIRQSLVDASALCSGGTAWKAR